MLNLQNPEDLFFCVDALTRARFHIGDGDPHLSQELEEIITSLMYLAENPPQETSPPPQPTAAAAPQQAQPQATPQAPPQAQPQNTQDSAQDANDLLAVNPENMHAAADFVTVGADAIAAFAVEEMIALAGPVIERRAGLGGSGDDAKQRQTYELQCQSAHVGPPEQLVQTFVKACRQDARPGAAPDRPAKPVSPHVHRRGCGG